MSATIHISPACPTAMSTAIHISPACPPLPIHLPDFLRLFDEATLWLHATGRTGQWGATPPSASPSFVQRTARILDDPTLTVLFARAATDSRILGIITFNEAPSADSNTPAAREREVYVHLLLTTRDRAYRGLGARLLEEAKKEARNRGISLLRLSCYAGPDGGMVRVYEKMGFSRNPREVIAVPNWDGGGPWPKAVMEMRVEEERRDE